MKAAPILALAGALASSATAQSLDIVISFASQNMWSIDAYLNNPTGTIRAVIADLSFTLNASNISSFTYNPAFDSTFFGAASVTVTPTQIDFSGGNTLPPLNNPGGPDSSNPLHIGTYVGDFPSGMTINGQLSGAYVGSPFDDVFFYQNANGSPGSVPFRIIAIPAPASVSVLGFAGIAAMRRRR